MAIKISKRSSAPTTAIRSLEKFLGTKLPKSYRTFVKTHDGAEPESNTFPIGDTNSSGVRRFIAVGEILSARKTLADEVSSLAFPIAYDECGNYVVLDMEADGAILFWDHETGDTTTVAGSFDEFLSILRPFNIDDVELDPDDVEDAWISPKLRALIDRDDEET